MNFVLSMTLICIAIAWLMMSLLLECRCTANRHASGLDNPSFN